MTIIPPPATQTVVIQFEGICVNFRRTDFPFLPAAHRIVLINASTITDVWGNIISPHLAGFSVGADPAVPTTPLTGSVVQIANPVQTGVVYDPSYHLLPSLCLLTPGLGGPSMAVLTGHNPELVSCYFDINNGVISSVGSTLNAAMTVVTVQTTGDPLYQLTPFATVLSSSPILEVEPQPATNQMFFSNEETNISEASDDDFLLSYLVLSQPPLTTPNLPEGTSNGSAKNRKSEIAKLFGIVALTEVGCSNSAYP